jgi:hypothetical protein
MFTVDTTKHFVLAQIRSHPGFSCPQKVTKNKRYMSMPLKHLLTLKHSILNIYLRSQTVTINTPCSSDQCVYHAAWRLPSGSQLI